MTYSLKTIRNAGPNLSPLVFKSKLLRGDDFFHAILLQFLNFETVTKAIEMSVSQTSLVTRKSGR